MSGRCVGGLEAIDYFESLPVPEGQDELREYALNRIRYEIAKGIGTKIRVTPPPKKGYHETRTCGSCGCGVGEVWHKYCPNCGMMYLKNDYTVKKIKEYEDGHQISLSEWLEVEKFESK